MDETERTWLSGLRRAHVSSGALDRWTDEDGLTGAIWFPAAFVPSDYAAPVVSLVDAGAKPDRSLVWDLAVTDVRDAADVLRAVYRRTDGADGYAALWLFPDRLADPGAAAAHARDALTEIARDNAAVAFAWEPGRAGALSTIVAAGVPVVLTGADPRAVAEARERGMQRRRRDAEDPDDIEEVPVFLLGATLPAPAPADGDEDAQEQPVRGVRLVTETDLVHPGPDVTPRPPADPPAERAGLDAALAGLAAVAAGPGAPDEMFPASFAASVASRAAGLERLDVPLRIWKRDHTVWGPEPEEIADRLGWLDVAAAMLPNAGELASFGRAARSGGLTRVVLLGMGGSSLAPETFHGTLPSGIGLTVLDSTDPDHVAAVTASIDAERTMFVVSSKSGSTVETLSHLEHMWALSGRGERFVAVTDPGSRLAEIAAQRGFRRCFENPPDIGGRYSALSYFGLVPAAICGIDLETILRPAVAMAAACGPSVQATDGPGYRLGAALGDAARDGRDKLTLVLPPAVRALGAWIEQLIAESTGKEGTGILPVDGEDLGDGEVYGYDRLFVAYACGADAFPERLDALSEDHPVVRIRVPGPEAVGAEMFRWEMAVAVAGEILGVNPFDQPDVEAAKVRAREALSSPGGPAPDRGSAAEILDELKPPQYVAIQAFVAPADDTARRLQIVRMLLRDRYRVATTVGFGPRFLHSTGQLHKGGPDTGVFLQVTGPHATDVDVPGSGYTFGTLIDAQADGDLAALRDAGRRVARVTLEELEALVRPEAT